MVHFEDIDGKKYLVKPEDISSIEETEQDGIFEVIRDEGLSSIKIDLATFNDLSAFLAQPYDVFWASKAKEFSEMLEEEEEKEDVDLNDLFGTSYPWTTGTATDGTVAPYTYTTSISSTPQDTGTSTSTASLSQLKASKQLERVINKLNKKRGK